MRSPLLIIIPFLFLGACKGKNKIPSDVLPQKKMQAVLWDVMRADHFLSNYVLNRDSSLDKIKESFKYYGQVFAIHKITKEQFEKSFAFYKDHPALLKVIMDSIGRSPQEAPTQLVTPVEETDSMQPALPPAIPDTAIKLRKLRKFSKQ